MVANRHDALVGLDDVDERMELIVLRHEMAELRAVVLRVVSRAGDAEFLRRWPL